VDAFLPAFVGGLLALGLLSQRFTAVRRRRIDAVLSAAAHEAMARTHERITIEHLLLPLSFDDEIEALLSTKGIDAERLREGLVEELALVEKATEMKRLPELDSRATLVLQLAGMRRAHPTPRSLLEMIETGPASRARALLAQTDAPRSNPDLAPRDDARGPYRSPPARGNTAVRFWNDSKTPVAFVIAALVESVGLERARAVYLAYRVHFERSYVVARRARREADELAANIERHARDNGFPLRVTTEPVE
jgi:ATP-dependent Clp protease adapter protein ClpS